MKYLIERDYVSEKEFFKSIIPFLEAISSQFFVDAVFAKPKSVNQKYYDYLSGKYNLTIADREKINDISYLSKFINPNRDGFILIDIGGYFATISAELKNKFGDYFLGSIEDTENGFLRYISNKIDYPLYQVARSPLKTNEDYLVGQAVSFSAESIFRENGVLLNGQKVGIIGYGKIGSGVANAFKSRQSIVLVNDIDPIKITHSYSQGFIPQNKDILLKNSDIICLASGNKSLVNSDFSKIKTGAYVFTITSSDNELDLDWLNNNYSAKEISPLITHYSKDKHYFYLLNNGNAINFIHGTTVSTFILLVQAEIIACSLALALKIPSDNSYSISSKIRQSIAKEWLKIFTSQYN